MPSPKKSAAKKPAADKSQAQAARRKKPKAATTVASLARAPIKPPARSRPQPVIEVEEAGGVVPKASPKPSKPKKPAVDADWQANMREAMARQRQLLLSVVQSTQAQMAEKSGDLPDVSDRASEGFEDELAVGLMAIEAAHLDDIDAAIKRIDDGTYGLCTDCKKPIPRKRLEVLPFARRCLNCEGASERRGRVVEATAEDEDWD